MVFDWNDAKNRELQESRAIGFGRIVVAMEEGKLLDILKHPNEGRYLSQYLLIFDIDGYAFVVPAIRQADGWFLKTIFPSRKYTDRYLPERRKQP